MAKREYQIVKRNLQILTHPFHVMNILNAKLREEKSRVGEWTYVIKSLKNVWERKNREKIIKMKSPEGKKTTT